MNDPQNEPRTCPYCDQPRQDTFENQFRFECGTSLRADDHKAVKQGDACQLRVELRAAQAELARLQHESTAHRVAWQNAEQREREMVTTMVEIATCKVTPFRDACFYMQQIARAALAKHKEVQP